MQHRKDCEEALLNSELGKRYFASEGSGESAVLEGLEQGNLYIALIKDRCAGFFYYLHLIAVKEEYRGQGIGRKLIDYLENVVCADAHRLFLVVADFNPEAKRFYEKNGYRQVGEIPGLYREGITEYIMMKEN